MAALAVAVLVLSSIGAPAALADSADYTPAQAVDDQPVKKQTPTTREVGDPKCLIIWGLPWTLYCSLGT